MRITLEQLRNRAEWIGIGAGRKYTIETSAYGKSFVDVTDGHRTMWTEKSAQTLWNMLCAFDLGIEVGKEIAKKEIERVSQ